MEVDSFLELLAGVKKRGSGLVALCPAHEDHQPSLSVDLGDDGRVLVTCHAGCSNREIVEAMGLKLSDLFPDRVGPRDPIFAEYAYRDESGTVLYVVERRSPKRFVQKRPGANGYEYTLDGVRRVPYRLPELLEDIKLGRWVLIVEGEKDVHSVVDAGFVGTCNAGGAGKWRDEWAEMFVCARVAVLSDNDEPGRKHAEQVARSLAGVAAVVKIVNLPGLDEHGDVTDWLRAGGSADALQQLVLNAPAWVPPEQRADREQVSDPDPGDAVGQPLLADEDGARLLDDLAAFVLRFCAFPSEHCVVAIALWIVHTHCIDAFELTPRLAFVSETKQTGKSRALEVIDLTAACTRYVASMTTAYLFRLVDSMKPTLLFDEVDTVFGPRARDNEELRALINVGFRRSATVGRCVGDGSRQTPTEFKAFAPLALAGIGDCLPDTVLDRSIVLRMRRRAPDEAVEALRYRKVTGTAAVLRERLAAWGAAETENLTSADPDMPEGITDRPADTWEALLAVADAAGGTWPERARAACVALNDARSAEDNNLSVRLLADLRTVLDADAAHTFSATLCERLNALEESPWSGWNDSKGIAPRDLARRLKGFGITSKKVRIGVETRQGYDTDAFKDPFARYLASRNIRNARNTPGCGVPDVPPVPDNPEAWERDALARLHPDAEDHGLQVARVRAEGARQRKARS